MGAQMPGIGDEQTLRQAGHRMRELGVTALWVLAADGTRLGTVSSDMVVRCIAAGADPKVVTVAELVSRPKTVVTGGSGFWPAHPALHHAA